MNIKSIRESRNLTQDDLAKMLGKNRSTISMWESGRSNPRADALIKLSMIFGCTIDELLTGLKDMEVAGDAGKSGDA